MPAWYWSFLLTAVGVFGLFLSGKKKKIGWAVGFFAQIIWVIYATATHQWGFYISALAYGWVYAKNWISWRKEEQNGYSSRQDTESSGT